MENVFSQLILKVYELLQSYGIWGLGLSMFAESIGVPFASLFFILTAGHLALNGTLSVLEIIGISTLGITAGSALSYALGYATKKTGSVLWLKFHLMHHERNQHQFQPLTKNERAEQLRAYLKKYGFLAIVLAQLFGFTRTFVSFPAGAMEINFWQFIVFTALGGALFSLMALLGSMLLSPLLLYLLRLSFGVLIVIAVGVAISIYFYRRFKHTRV